MRQYTKNDKYAKLCQVKELGSLNNLASLLLNVGT